MKLYVCLIKVQQGKKEVKAQKEEHLPHAGACEARGKRIDFIVLNSSSDSDNSSTNLSTSTKHQVKNCVLFFHFIVVRFSYYIRSTRCIKIFDIVYVRFYTISFQCFV